MANRRSITETANARYISQPAVSKAIQSLEKELSLKLFHRDKKNGMIPTEAGKKILLLARQMEDLENRIYQTAFRENNFIGGKLRIASVPVTTTVLLSKVLRHSLTENAPIGTFSYAAPEQVKGDNYDHRIDIYSLGLVLYELANRNRLPFAKTSQAQTSSNGAFPTGTPCPSAEAEGSQETPKPSFPPPAGPFSKVSRLPPQLQISVM